MTGQFCPDDEDRRRADEQRERIGMEGVMDFLEYTLGMRPPVEYEEQMQTLQDATGASERRVEPIPLELEKVRRIGGGGVVIARPVGLTRAQARQSGEWYRIDADVVERLEDRR